MDRALELAARGVALTSPNPLVGAVLVRDGQVKGEGFHTYEGVRHAEVEAGSSGQITLQTFGGPGNPYVDPTNLVDPVDGQPYTYTPGPGTCTSDSTSFEIHDVGGHDATTLQYLPQLSQTVDSVAYCAGVGIMADDSQLFMEKGQNGH